MKINWEVRLGRLGQWKLYTGLDLDIWLIGVAYSADDIGLYLRCCKIRPKSTAAPWRDSGTGEGVGPFASGTCGEVWRLAWTGRLSLRQTDDHMVQVAVLKLVMDAA